MYTVYTLPGSCSSGIVVLLEKLGVQYQPVKRDEVEDYRAIVPTNQVPALRTEKGQIIAEGAAIVLYLLEKHNSPMLPSDLSEKAEFLRWLMFDYATLHPSYGKMFAIKFRVEMDELERQKVLLQLGQAVSGMWTILDRELADKRFITGDQPTIVDYLAAIYASWNTNFPADTIHLGQNVQRMIEEVTALPEFRAGYEREGIRYKKPF